MYAERCRLGVFGGTFDPVHLGHLRSVREVADAFGLERVLLIVSARPPHKGGTASATAEQRLAMLELALAGDDRLVADDRELRRQGPSYTIDTLEDLQRSRPDAELFLIVGIDAYREIDTWHRSGDLLAVANLVVTSRPGHPLRDEDLAAPVAARGATRYDPAIARHVHTSGHSLYSHHIRGIDISASEIRDHIRRGLPVERWTGAAVARYIARHRLYGAPAN